MIVLRFLRASFFLFLVSTSFGAIADYAATLAPYTATNTWRNGDVYHPASGTSPLAVCQASAAHAGISGATLGPFHDGSPKWYSCYYANGTQDTGWSIQLIGCPSGSSWSSTQRLCVAYSCPNGGTLNGQTCVHSCPAGQTEQPDGTCLAQCPMYPGAVDEPSAQPANCQCPSGSVWFYNGCRKKCSGSGETAGAGVWGDPTIFYPGGAAEGCYNGCGVQGVPGVFYKANGGEYYNHSTYTGWACNGNGEGTKPTPDNQPQPNNPEKPAGEPHEPKCNGENVVTRSDGTVVCMPAGTPNTNKPKVDEGIKKETYDDGSTKETKVTETTDPGTGAKYQNITVTVTPATGGGAGKAGTPGTSTGTSSSGTSQNGSGSGQNGGECDATKQACGGPGKFGDNDKLYTAKYPDGLEGLLTTKYNDLKSTPVFGLVAQLAPTNLPNAGQCPSWSFASNISQVMPFGAGSFAPPCYVWDVVKLVFLITALLTARRIIFGG